MCKHSNILTHETCAVCREHDDDPAACEPIYEGMTSLDNQAARLGGKMRGFKFSHRRRVGAKGRRRGRNGAE